MFSDNNIGNSSNCIIDENKNCSNINDCMNINNCNAEELNILINNSGFKFSRIIPIIVVIIIFILFFGNNNDC